MSACRQGRRTLRRTGDGRLPPDEHQGAAGTSPSTVVTVTGDDEVRGFWRATVTQDKIDTLIETNLQEEPHESRGR